MWELFIAFFVVSIIGFFMYHRLRRSPEKDKSKLAGKYSVLISELSQGRPHYLRAASKVAKFSVKKGRDQYVYLLTETEGRLSVVWTIESQMYGRRGKEWLFEQGDDQMRISAIIQSDLQLYLKSIHTT